MNKETYIRARCTHDQKKAIEQKAQKTGESVSSFLLKIALQENHEKLSDIKEFTQVRKTMSGELRAIGVNINQVAKRLNTEEVPSFKESDRELLEELKKMIVEMRNQLNQSKY